jgi:arginine exporter protein ArgO
MSFAAFVVAAFVLAITPGPGIAYVVARTVAGGRSEGLASCFGTGIGGMLHVLAAALGLSLIIAQSAVAFSLVKYIGAAYRSISVFACCCVKTTSSRSSQLPLRVCAVLSRRESSLKP